LTQDLQLKQLKSVRHRRHICEVVYKDIMK
jgi:hypothetical protein